MVATLEIFEGIKARTISLRDELTAFGRESTCQVQFNDEKLSRKHCRIERKRGSYVLVDLSSKNGTSVNGIAVFPSRALMDGDEIRIGDVRMVFHNVSLWDRVLYVFHHSLLWRMVTLAAIVGALYGGYRGVTWFFTTLRK